MNRWLPVKLNIKSSLACIVSAKDNDFFFQVRYS